MTAGFHELFGDGGITFCSSRIVNPFFVAELCHVHGGPDIESPEEVEEFAFAFKPAVVELLAEIGVDADASPEHFEQDWDELAL